jgi:hypothetical protein
MVFGSDWTQIGPKQVGDRQAQARGQELTAVRTVTDRVPIRCPKLREVLLRRQVSESVIRPPTKDQSG